MQVDILAYISTQIAQAIKAAYDAGREHGKMDAEEDIEERLDNAFDEGFEQGQSFQELEDAVAIDECVDDGYLEGVEDFRVRPAFAEQQVQRIINERAAAAFDRLDEMLVDEA